MKIETYELNCQSSPFNHIFHAIQLTISIHVFSISEAPRHADHNWKRFPLFDGNCSPVQLSQSAFTSEQFSIHSIRKLASRTSDRIFFVVSHFFTPIHLTPYHLTPIYSPLYHLTPLSFNPTIISPRF